MKINCKVIAAAGALGAVICLSGCDAPNAAAGANAGSFWGSIAGPLMSAAGVPASTVNLTTTAMTAAGAVIGQINADQIAQLQAQSPQTVVVIQRNEQVAANQTTDPVLPLSVDNIEALIAVGAKPDAIVDEIQKARAASSYTQADIGALRQAYPNVDPSITQAML